MSKQKLTKAQAELLDAIRGGMTCHFMSGMDGYYFRSDTMKRCTTQVVALMRRGLVEVWDADWRGHKVRAVKADE